MDNQFPTLYLATFRQPLQLNFWLPGLFARETVNVKEMNQAGFSSICASIIEWKVRNIKPPF